MCVCVCVFSTVVDHWGNKRGGANGSSIIGVTCGSPGFWVIIGLAIPFLVGITVFVARRLTNEHKERVAAGYEFHPNDVIYTPRVIVIYPILGALAGCAAGFLGIGAGMVVAPIMLEIGVLAEVAQARFLFLFLFLFFFFFFFGVCFF
jgi:uncharacterized membrane protein YfcA